MKTLEMHARTDPVDSLVSDMTATEIVDWMIEFHGLPESSRETVENNLKSQLHWHRLRGRLDRYPAWAALAELLLRRPK